MEEIKPPWIEHPEYPPYDTFWRQSGYIWFVYVWEPYWQSLSQEQKEKYLCVWDVPHVWKDCYFNPIL